MNKNICCCIFFAIFLISCAFDSNSKNENSLLWRVTKKGSNKASYLFGTMHHICSEDYVWTDSMQKCYLECDELCLEADASDTNELNKIRRNYIDTGDKYLKNYFSQLDYVDLTIYCKSHMNFSLDQFSKYKPVMLLALISSRNVNCRHLLSMENNLMQKAKKDNKSISGLESAEEVIAISSKMSNDSAAKCLLNIIRNSEKDEKIQETMMIRYKEQNIRALYELINSSKEYLGESMYLLLDDRNVKWIPHICEKMRLKQCFFAVGAGHLYGENGLINLLKKSGYIVEPIR